jgi:uncharacterized membrane protein
MPSVETHETDDERMLHRMLFFTDAVFAIVLTLLALELKPPQTPDAREALVEIGNHLTTFAMSFAVVAVFWLSHLSMMRRLAHFDWLTALMNLVFMAPVCLLPFASSLLNGAWFSSLGWQIYSWNLVLTSACLILLIVVSTRDGGRLVGGVSRRERWYRIVRAAAPGVAFLAGLIAPQLGWLSAPRYLWLWIPIQFWLAERFVKPKAASVPAA